MRELWMWVRTQFDRVLAGVAATAGAIFVFVGWLGVSGVSLTTEQVPYLASGAVGGVFALGIAATLWLSADMRDEWIKLDEIARLLSGEAERRSASTLDDGAGDDSSPREAVPERSVATDSSRDGSPPSSDRAPARARAGRR